MDNVNAKTSFKIGDANTDAGANKAEVDNTPSPVEEQPKPQAPASHCLRAASFRSPRPSTRQLRPAARPPW